MAQLQASLGLDTRPLQTGLDKARAELAKFGNDAQKSFSTFEREHKVKTNLAGLTMDLANVRTAGEAVTSILSRMSDVFKLAGPIAAAVAIGLSLKQVLEGAASAQQELNQKAEKLLNLDPFAATTEELSKFVADAEEFKAKAGEDGILGRMLFGKSKDTILNGVKAVADVAKKQIAARAEEAAAAEKAATEAAAVQKARDAVDSERARISGTMPKLRQDAEVADLKAAGKDREAEKLKVTQEFGRLESASDEQSLLIERRLQQELEAIDKKYDAMEQKEKEAAALAAAEDAKRIADATARAKQAAEETVRSKAVAIVDAEYARTGLGGISSLAAMGGGGGVGVASDMARSIVESQKHTRLLEELVKQGGGSSSGGDNVA